jgi:hypothetical protein
LKAKLVIVTVAAAALWYGGRAVVNWHHANVYRGALDEIANFIPVSTTADPSHVFDIVRQFVNDNSKGVMDAEFYGYWDKPHVMAQTLLAYLRRERTEPVHLECSRRVGLMQGILFKLGYETRRIDLYDHENLGRQHTLLEALNPMTGRWETQDPLYDIYWREKSTGQRASITFASDVLDELEPCGRSSCDWGVSSSENHLATTLRDHLDYMVVRTRGGDRFTVYSSRVNAGTYFTYKAKTGGFCDVLAKNCRDGFMSVREHRRKPPALDHVPR